MKLRILAVILLPACTIIPTRHGKAQFWGDYRNVDYTDGGVHFKADEMVHSTVARVHWHGATTLGGEALSAYTGGPAAVGGVSALTSLVNRPTNRTTPTPTPKPKP